MGPKNGQVWSWDWVCKVPRNIIAAVHRRELAAATILCSLSFATVSSSLLFSLSCFFVPTMTSTVDSAGNSRVELVEEETTAAVAVPDSGENGESGKLKMIVQLVKKCLGVKDIASMCVYALSV